MSSVFSLDNKLLLHHEEKKDASADALTDGFKLDLSPLLSTAGVVFVKLELRNAAGAVVADNFYWLGADNASYRKLNRLAPASVSVTAEPKRSGDEIHVQVALRNTGTVAALASKLTLLNADGSRILPAYYSDNYVSLLPGESREIIITYPAKSATGSATVAIRGWNLVKQSVPVAR